jgi:hypothetical protein
MKYKIGDKFKRKDNVYFIFIKSTDGMVCRCDKYSPEGDLLYKGIPYLNDWLKSSYNIIDLFPWEENFKDSEDSFFISESEYKGKTI